MVDICTLFVDGLAKCAYFVWSQNREGAKIKTTKISSGGDTGESAKICTSENFPLYGTPNISVDKITGHFKMLSSLQWNLR